MNKKGSIFIAVLVSVFVLAAAFVIGSKLSFTGFTIDEEFVNETNITDMNETESDILINETDTREINEIIVNISLEEYDCEEFSENVLWSSGYSNKENSIKYYTWNINNSCENCFISELELKTRFLSFAEEDITSYGAIQISELVDCGNSENGKYETYLTSETIKGEGKKQENYRTQQTNFYSDSCYGMKLYADKNFIIDVFEIKYKLCKNVI